MIGQAQDERAIFFAALERPAGPERDAYLREACSGESDLLNRVRWLFSLHEQSQGPLDLPPPGLCITAAANQPAEQPGTVIGRYKLLEQVGEGGMGIVFVAEQTEPVRRRVALKIIKPGMDTKQVIARFEAERQALAMMDHPNIARVLDAGTTEAGRPYFVMELVRGMPITEYCDKARLSPRQRLELFVDICQAVQHAHQKGIIHRDLKPSNVMVTMQDGRPVVKVIDFGVAKAVGQQLTERTVYTALTQLVGTPLYMSPEQAELTSNDVDTRSDVYSLGVLLYELLTGQTPFDKETLAKAGLDEMRRIIREDEPLRPSRLFSTLGAAAISTASQHRGLDERRLCKILCGELDWIVMKALEKDRSRRYESASALATDIERYLSDEPVLACPPTTMYRFQKFARKHKPALAAAFAIAACLLLGTTVSAWQAIRATTAEADAKANANQAQTSAQEAKAKAQEASAQRNEAQKQRNEAQKQRDEVRTLNDKLQSTQSELRGTLYAAHMNLAQQAWNSQATERAVQLLNLYQPKPGEPDMRGFEWHYLHRLCEADQLPLVGHAGYVSCAAFSPNGKRAATSAADRTIKIWEVASGKEILTLRGHSRTVRSIAFSASGGLVASASFQWSSDAPKGELMVWDVTTGKERLALKDFGGFPVVAISPDGKQIAAGYRNVRLWDIESARETLVIQATEGELEAVTALAYSPDGKRLASGVGNPNYVNEKGLRPHGVVSLWDAQTGKSLFSAKHPRAITAMTFSPDGRHLATGSPTNAVVVCNAETGESLFTLKGQTATNEVSSVAYNADGKRLLATFSDKTVKTWDADTGEILVAGTWHAGFCRATAFDMNGVPMAVITDDQSALVKSWPAKPGQSAKAIVSANTNFAVFSPDGNCIAAGSGILVKVWDWRSGQELISLEGHTGGTDRIVFSPDGKRLATGSYDRTARVWDLQTGKELTVIRAHTATVQGIAISPDGKQLATGSWDGTVRLWESDTWRELHTLKHDGSVYHLKYSPDGRTLASACGDGTVRLWDPQTGSLVRKCVGPRGICVGLAYSPDGSRVAAGSFDHHVWIWDADSGDVVMRLQGHSDRVNRLAYSPDGKRLASSGYDLSVILWDTETGHQLLSFKPAGVAVAFTPDGHHLAIGSIDKGLQTSDGARKGVEILDARPLSEKP